jgi:hypothetical protein
MGFEGITRGEICRVFRDLKENLRATTIYFQFVAPSQSHVSIGV